MPVPHNLEDVIVELDNVWYYEDPIDRDTMRGPYAEMSHCVSDFKADQSSSYF